MLGESVLVLTSCLVRSSGFGAAARAEGPNGFLSFQVDTGSVLILLRQVQLVQLTFASVVLFK